MASCRWPPSDATRSRVRAAADGVDWSRVAAIVARHRVDALVHRTWCDAAVEPPAPVGERMAAAARRATLRSLAMAAETQRLVQLCARRGVPALVLKGAALGQLAYGDVALKQAVDIDLAIGAADLPAARRLMLEAGYSPEALVVAKDEPWFHAARGVRVELHAALVDFDGWLDGVRVGGSIRHVPLGGAVPIPTLGDDHLFAYLCVHGAAHGWARLKWLADLAAYLADKPPAELERLAKVGDRLGAGRCAAQALLLGADLFGIRLDPGHARALRRSPANRWLVADAIRSFTGRNETIELDAQPLGTVRIHLAQLVFTRGAAGRLRLLAHKLGYAGEDRDRAGSAAGWRRVARWLRRRWRRGSAFRGRR